MSEHTVLNDAFTLERDYPAPPARVFAAWAEPAARSRWFAGPDAAHELDFRVGGREIVRGAGPDGVALRAESVYHDIVDGTRIVYTTTLSAGDTLATVSLTTVSFAATDAGTRLTLTEQGAFLDGQEQPDWRQQGTRDQLAALERELADAQV